MGQSVRSAAAGPIRSCRVCRTRKPKAELTRWVRQGSQLTRDDRQLLPGRGWYSCSPACAERLQRVALAKRTPKR